MEHHGMHGVRVQVQYIIQQQVVVNVDSFVIVVIVGMGVLVYKILTLIVEIL